jgi:anti-sigma regulatory factor (Ser/Thr protein kinase)
MTAVTASAFRHPALFYRGSAEYLAGTVPFVRDGLAAGEPVAVAVPPENLAILAGGLGAAAGSVHFLDMTQVGRNPGRIIPGVLRAFADTHPEQRVRIIGEPIWPGRTELEYPACVQHEALINHAFADRAVTILCPYDVEGLAATTLKDAAATHPVLIAGDREWSSEDYCPDTVVARYNCPLPLPAGPVAERAFDIDGLAGLRRFVVDESTRAGLSESRRDDLELMVNELASNAVQHGGGTGVVRVWVDPPVDPPHRGRLGCEVTSAGRLSDPLAGRRPVRLDDDRGRGLLLVNHLADLVRVHSDATGTTVRMYLSLR